MLKELQEFGLLEKEARVYLASLEIGKATVDEISKHADVKRPTTYVQIESLMEKGLMSKYDEDKKTYFIPESPEYLKRLFEKNQQALELREKGLGKVLPELKHLFEHAGERPKVRFFDGKEGITTMREEFLKVKSKEMQVIYSVDAILEVFSEEEIKEYIQKRSAAKITTKSLYTYQKGKIVDPPPPNTETRFIPSKKLSLDTDIVVYDDNVGIISLRGKLFGIIVQSEEIARSMRSMFNLLWETAEKYQ